MSTNKTTVQSMLNKSSAVADMGDRLATIDMGFYGGQLGPHLTQCRLD